MSLFVTYGKTPFSNDAHSRFPQLRKKCCGILAKDGNETWYLEKERRHKGKKKGMKKNMSCLPRNGNIMTTFAGRAGI